MSYIKERKVEGGGFLSHSDYRAYLFWNYFKGARGVLRKISISLWLIIFAFSCLIYSATGDITAKALIYLSVVVFLILIVVYPLQIVFISKNILKKDKLLQKEQHYSVYNEGFTVTTDSSKTEVKWSDIRKVVELNRAFVFLIAPNRAFLLPKTYLSSNEDVNEIRDIIRVNFEVKNAKLKG